MFVAIARNGLTAFLFFFFQAEDGIRDYKVTGVHTCALPIYGGRDHRAPGRARPGRSREVRLRALPHPHGRGLPRPPRRGRLPAVRPARRVSALEARRDRKSVVEGKSGELGGRRIIKKKKTST